MAQLVWSAMPVTPDEIIPSGPLFKLLSLADEQTPRWQDRLDQLLGGKAYFPSPSQFNDPFDCLPTITIPATIEDLRNQKNLLSYGLERYVPGVTKEYIADVLERTFNAVDLEEIATLVRGTINKTSRDMGVFSLTETISSVLMWSHYASNHTGIAVRFDWRRQLRGGLMPLFKVRYEDRRPSILNFFDGHLADDSDDIVDALRTKAGFWRYEKEWRSLAPHTARKIVDFDPAVIDGIILGANCSAENEEWIRAKVHDRRLPVIRAVPDRDTYDIHFAVRHDDVASLNPEQGGFPER